MFRDMGVSVSLHSRTGLGKTRHIAVVLWVQERVKQGDLHLHQIRGDVSPADLMITHGSRDIMITQMNTFNFSFEGGRSAFKPTA